MLNRLGMCASYDETLLYEGPEVISATSIIRASHESFVQCVFDNTDYGVRIIDGRNTFHYTRGIEFITPAGSIKISLSIKRLNPPPQASTIANKYKVKMYDYTVPDVRGFSKIKIKDVCAVRFLQSEKTILLPGELLWVARHLLRISEHSGWNGLMEFRTNSTLYYVSKIKYLPFIYLKVTDEFAILSAMMFGFKKSKKINQKNVFFYF